MQVSSVYENPAGRLRNVIVEVIVENARAACETAVRFPHGEIDPGGLFRLQIGIADFKSQRGDVRAVGKEFLLIRRTLGVGGGQRGGIARRQSVNRAKREPIGIELPSAARPEGRIGVGVHAGKIHPRSRLDCQWVAVELFKDKAGMRERLGRREKRFFAEGGEITFLRLETKRAIQSADLGLFQIDPPVVAFIFKLRARRAALVFDVLVIRDREFVFDGGNRRERLVQSTGEIEPALTHPDGYFRFCHGSVIGIIL